MFRIRLGFLFAVLISCFFLNPGRLHAQPANTTHLSMGKLDLATWIDPSGTPTYSLQFAGRPVILPSALGFVLNRDETFNSGFVLTGASTDSLDQTWNTVWGEETQIRNHYRELTLHLQQTATQKKLDLVFRVFAEGLAFRYTFPKQPGLNYFIIREELTGFNMAGDHKAFWIPGDYDSNEYPYTHSALTAIDNRDIVAKSTDIAVRTVPDPHAVQTPLMMKSADGLYINLHEAALYNYPAMQLHVDRQSLGLRASLVPDAYGNKAYVQTPFSTPWRTIIVSDKAADILASRMILNLNEPCKLENTSWIRPMKFVGVWWEMQTGIGTWSYARSADDKNASGQLIPSGQHSANTANVKRYIDFASANGIDGVLVEGWNTGWEDWFGNWKENVFDFVTPYPDFAVDELQAYAAAKGVQLIMHNETSGSATNYERFLDTAFRFMNNHGYHTVKTGYVGRIIPRGEAHDGQWMVNHYFRVAEKAAAHRVMIDVHEPMRPTGQSRTYPNWMASEAGRGNEYHAFSNGNAPDHETILPFTRLMGGPMDYTPGIFKLKGYSPVDSNRQVNSTLAKQLALYVTLYSPIQMAADLPENYAPRMDAFRFIREVPLTWERSLVLEAEPGDYLSMARKAVGKEEWYIGAVTDENSRKAVWTLDFLPKGKKFEAIIYSDGPGADWQRNPESYAIRKQVVDAKTKLTVNLARGGGAAVSIRPL